MKFLRNVNAGLIGIISHVVLRLSDSPWNNRYQACVWFIRTSCHKVIGRGTGQSCAVTVVSYDTGSVIGSVISSVTANGRHCPNPIVPVTSWCIGVRLDDDTITLA